ncbi:MAG TPA: TetR/AcrR family transcriptional regulator [Chromatiales bacterium]|nr:TetR/AcrR family transcriptional regulator [Chromatiales bacterium]
MAGEAPRPEAGAFCERIVDAAVALAEEHGSWEAVRLHHVADRLGVGLEEIRACFPEKDALIDAWFDRADRAALAAARAPDFRRRPLRARLVAVMWAWLEALAAHRRVTRQMILAKLEPGHIHIQIPALVRISRTVQWMREAAGIEHAGPRRAIEETALTAVYLAVFARWLADASPGRMETRHLLERLVAAFVAVHRPREAAWTPSPTP